MYLEKIREIVFQEKIAQYVDESLLPPLDYLHHKPGFGGNVEGPGPIDYNPYHDPTFLKDFDVESGVRAALKGAGGLTALGGGGLALSRALRGQHPGNLPLIVGGLGLTTALSL